MEWHVLELGRELRVPVGWAVLAAIGAKWRDDEGRAAGQLLPYKV